MLEEAQRIPQTPSSPEATASQEFDIGSVVVQNDWTNTRRTYSTPGNYPNPSPAPKQSAIMQNLEIIHMKQKITLMDLQIKTEKMNQEILERKLQRKRAKRSREYEKGEEDGKRKKL